MWLIHKAISYTLTVHEANIHDTVAGCTVFKETLQKYPSLQGVCADAGYRKTMEEFVKNILNKTIQISYDEYNNFEGPFAVDQNNKLVYPLLTDKSNTEMTKTIDLS